MSHPVPVPVPFPFPNPPPPPSPVLPSPILFNPRDSSHQQCSRQKPILVSRITSHDNQHRVGTSRTHHHPPTFPRVDTADGVRLNPKKPTFFFCFYPPNRRPPLPATNGNLTQPSHTHPGSEIEAEPDFAQVAFSKQGRFLNSTTSPSFLVRVRGDRTET